MLPDDLSKQVFRDAALAREKVWEIFVTERQGKGDLTEIEVVDQTAHHLLCHHWHYRFPVVLAGKEWMEGERQRALDHGTQFTIAHTHFLRQEHV